MLPHIVPCDHTVINDIFQLFATISVLFVAGGMLHESVTNTTDHVSRITYYGVWPHAV